MLQELKRDAENHLEIALGEVDIQIFQRADNGQETEDVHGHARVRHDLRELLEDAREGASHGRLQLESRKG